MLRYPGERSAKARGKSSTADDLLLAIRRRYEPGQVFGGLLWHARVHGYRDGWAYFVFAEIYGVKPTLDDQAGEPLRISGSDLESWVLRRKGKQR